MIQRDRYLPGRSRSRAKTAAAAAVAMGLAVASGASLAAAGARVEGDAATVQLTASQAPVSEILSTLGATFKVRYRTSVPLDRVIDATYAGSLEHVIARALTGYNYVLKKEADSIEVIVIGRRGDRAVASETPKPPPPRHTATQWRTPTGPTAPAPKP